MDVDGMNLSSVPLFAFSGQPRASFFFACHLVDKDSKSWKLVIRVVRQNRQTEAFYPVEPTGYDSLYYDSLLL